MGQVWLVTWMAALAAGSLFSALAQSLRDVARTVLEDMALRRNNDRARQRVRTILSDIEGHATAILIPRVACNLLVVVAMAFWVAGIRVSMATAPIDPSGVPSVDPARVSPSWHDGLIAIGASTLLVWVFGTLLPTAIARHAAEPIVYVWSPLLRFAFLIASPFKSIGSFFDNLIRRMVGKTEEQEAEAIQEDVLSAVHEAKHEGQFDEAETKMIEAVVSFRNTTVGQIMTPRTEIEALQATSDLGKVVAFIRKGGHSRIPVYGESLDEILGFFYVKDLIRWLAGVGPSGEGGGARGGRTFDLKSLLRPAMYVPETKTVRELLGELLAKRVHIAVVADEFGGTAGLVTIEDIVEEVFGDIQDEYEEPERQSDDVKVDPADKSAEIDARAYIDDVNPRLHELGVELPESEDYDTVGGFVTVTLGRIPKAGETLRSEGVLVTVLEAEPTRVTRVRVQVVPNAVELVEQAARKGEAAGHA